LPSVAQQAPSAVAPSASAGDANVFAARGLRQGSTQAETLTQVAPDFAASVPSAPVTLNRASTSTARALDSQYEEIAAGCFKVRAGAVLAVEVCGPEQDPAWLKYANLATSGGALFASILAVLVARQALAFSRSQDQRARSRSVREDYWLRTVVSPTSIEPFQEFVSELRSSLPGLQSFGQLPPADKKAVYTRTAESFTKFSFQFQSLRLIDSALANEVASELELIEDGVMMYLGELQRVDATGTGQTPDLVLALSNLSDGMLRLFQLIQDYQVREAT